MYKYRIFVKAVGSKEKSMGAPLPNPIKFFSPLHKGEEVFLTSDIKELRDVPHWVSSQGTWIVENVIHRTNGDVEKMDIVTLIPDIPEREKVEKTEAKKDKDKPNSFVEWPADCGGIVG